MTPEETDRAISWLNGRVRELENIVARLERDSQAPTDLRPVIVEEIEKRLAQKTD